VRVNAQPSATGSDSTIEAFEACKTRRIAWTAEAMKIADLNARARNREMISARLTLGLQL